MLLSSTTTSTNGNADVAVAPSPPPPPIDVTLTCSDGISLSAQIWKPSNGTAAAAAAAEPPTTTVKHTTTTRKMLCVHGWMDNCRSYHYFAPHLLLQQRAILDHDDDDNIIITEIAAIDLPGHGWSSHKSSDAPPVHITDYVYYLAEAISQLPWSTTTATTSTSTNGSTNGEREMYDHESNGVENHDKDNNNNGIVLVGHSMGAAICCMYAAAFPEQVHKLVLLEGAGPMTRPGHEFTKHLRENIRQRRKQQQQQLPTVKPPRIYPTLHQAVTTRMSTVQKFPGQQYISEVTATELVVRGTRAVVPNGGGDTNVVGYQFRHDPRLQWPSAHYCTVEQVQAMYSDIQCPVALLLAQDGWPLSPEKKQRETEIREHLTPQVFVTLPGSHHFHSDPDTAEAVVETVVNFLNTK